MPGDTEGEGRGGEEGREGRGGEGRGEMFLLSMISL